MSSDEYLLKRFLEGSAISRHGVTIRTNGELVYQSIVGWSFLYRRYGASEPGAAPTPYYTLSLDISNLGRDGGVRYQRQVMEAARSVKPEPVVLPIALGAGQQVLRASYPPFKPAGPAPTVYEVNDGFESVFSYVHPGGETRYYLSGYDTQESPPLYFLCRLPGAAKAVDEARESLKPESVKKALAQGVEVIRQGDIFAIRSDLHRADIEQMGGKFCTSAGIYGTAHTAKQLARLPGGVMLGRDYLSHDPRLLGEYRSPDHAFRFLPGECWWWLTRNTVPLDDERRGG